MTRTVTRASAKCVIRNGGEVKEDIMNFAVNDTMNFDKCLSRWAKKNGVAAMRIEEEYTVRETWEIDDDTFFKYATVVAVDGEKFQDD